MYANQPQFAHTEQPHHAQASHAHPQHTAYQPQPGQYTPHYASNPHKKHRQETYEPQAAHFGTFQYDAPHISSPSVDHAANNSLSPYSLINLETLPAMPKDIYSITVTWVVLAFAAKVLMFIFVRSFCKKRKAVVIEEEVLVQTTNKMTLDKVEF
jgi:hypothetical protein